ncbi:hypothetical protein ACQ4PT_034349 [Festuca glaucescens]
MSTIEEWVVPPDAKKSWPKVVGLSSEEAKKKIMEDRSDADVHVIVPARSVVTMDYCRNRVREFVDSSSDMVIKALGVA